MGRSSRAPASEILPGLWFIERGYLNGNHFAYRADRPVLIDTAYVSHFGSTEEQLARLGLDLSRTSLIVNTHCHCDHVGGNRAIQDRSDCEVLLHPLGRQFMERLDDWSTWWRYYDQEADFFQCSGVLEDGEELPIGPYRFLVLHAPGHSADGLVLYEGTHRVLLSSDVLWEREMAVVTERVEGEGALRSLGESLERLADLDVRRVYPGHGSAFSDFRGALDRALTRVESYLEDRTRVGDDLLKKIVVYTLLMRGSVEEAGFFGYLMATRWFPDTVDTYFEGRYREKYDEVLRGLRKRAAVQRDRGRLHSSVRP